MAAYSEENCKLQLEQTSVLKPHFLSKHNMHVCAVTIITPKHCSEGIYITAQCSCQSLHLLLKYHLLSRHSAAVCRKCFTPTGRHHIIWHMLNKVTLHVCRSKFRVTLTWSQNCRNQSRQSLISMIYLRCNATLGHAHIWSLIQPACFSTSYSAYGR